MNIMNCVDDYIKNIAKIFSILINSQNSKNINSSNLFKIFKTYENFLLLHN
jgi:hypothetical protein